MTNTDELQTLLPLVCDWIRDRMAQSGGSSAIVGVSGGKDSSVTAALMVRALGAEHVLGVSMPDGTQHDIDFAQGICTHLGIRCKTVNIAPMTSAFLQVLEPDAADSYTELSNDTRINLPARVRMTVLYALSQSIPGSRVINTGNLSEDWVGYSTVYGDAAGAFAPLGGFTTDEVISLGRLLQIPEHFLVKVPEDGLTGVSDEEKLGFTYAALNRYIRTGHIDDREVKEKIDRMHRTSRFKFQTMPMYPAPFPIRAKDIANIYPW